MIPMDLVPWFYGSMLLAGSVFLLISIALGGLGEAVLGADFGFDLDLDLDLDLGEVEASEGRNLGCLTIAAFLAGFGAVGLVATGLQLPLVLGLLFALAIGVLVGRLTMGLLRFVLRQQSSAVIDQTSLLGKEARVTIFTPAGHVGEALVESGMLMKYPVEAVDGSPLVKGEIVTVLDVRNGHLIVRKT